jgi:release factor glutamine methyltransferase
LDDKKNIMTLLEYHDLFFKSLKSKIDKNELGEFFFWIIEHNLSINRINYMLNPQYLINVEKIPGLINSINQLKKNMPIQYVVGQTEFMGMKYFLNIEVLIPRPETEELVSWVLVSKPKNQKILDIGTGSGCIAISLAKFLKTCEITAWDLNNKILNVARKNAVLNNVDVSFEIQDIKSIKTKEKFDVIISNPPYITLGEKQFIKKNVLLHEPHKALFVFDKDPLFFYKKIISFALNSLKKNGCIYFEINEMFLEDVTKLLNNRGFYDIEHKKDFRSKNRMVKAFI